MGSAGGAAGRRRDRATDRGMPYVLVRESYMNGYCCVEGLPLSEGKILGERCLVCPDMRDEKHRRMEFSTSTVNLLNCLEQMGYRVVTSGAFVASQMTTSTNSSKPTPERFTQKEFIWTLHRSSHDLE